MFHRALFAALFCTACSAAGLFAGFPAYGATPAAAPAASKTSEPKISDWLPGQLKDVVAEMDSQIADANHKIAAANKKAHDYNYGVPFKGTPEWNKIMGEYRYVKANCPRHTPMPMPQVRACETRIHEVSAYNARITAEVKAALAERARIVREQSARLQRLYRGKRAAARMASMMTTCDQKDVLARKACLDKLFDNMTVTSSLDVVRVPDTFGGRKWTVREVIDRYKKSGDATPSQIMRLYKSIDRINVPSPGH